MMIPHHFSPFLWLRLFVLFLLAAQGYVHSFRATPVSHRAELNNRAVAPDALAPALPHPLPLFDPLNVQLDGEGVLPGVDAGLWSKPYPKLKGPTWKTWLRRLRTREDALSLHKISNLGFVISSTVILGGMMFTPDDQGHFLRHIPSWLGPFDTMFLVSSTTQALVSIPMIQKFRIKDPEAAATQLGMGLTSVLMAVYSSWEGPFCPDFLEDHWKWIFSVLILTVATYDHKAAFGNYDVIQQQMKDIGVNIGLQTWREQLRHLFCFRAPFILASVSNLIFLVVALQTPDRQHLLHLIQSGYDLPCFSGADLPLIYFTTVMAGTVISYQSLLATLANKKLLSADQVTKWISASIFALTCGFLQCLFAHSIYNF